MSLQQNRYESEEANGLDRYSDSYRTDDLDRDVEVFGGGGGGGGGGYSGGSSSSSSNNNTVDTNTNDKADEILDDLTLDKDVFVEELNRDKNEGVTFQSGPAVGNTAVVDYSVDDEFDIYLLGIKNGPADYNISDIANIFGVPTAFFKAVYDEYRTTQSILAGKGYWVNTIRFSEFKEKLDSLGYVLKKTFNNAPNQITNQIEEHDWAFTNGDESLYFDVRFLRPYVYNATKINVGTTISPSNWSDINLTFSVVGESSKYSISYTNINGFLWFKLSSYFKVKSILIAGIDKNNLGAQIPIYVDNELYGESETNKPEAADATNAMLLTSFMSKDYTYRYTDQTGNNIVQNLNIDLYNSINSEKYFEISTADETDDLFAAKIYEFKLYLGNIIREWQENPDNIGKKYDIQVFVDLSETFTVDSDDPVFKAYSNTKTSVMWVNKEYILHDTFPRSSLKKTETPTGEPTSEDPETPTSETTTEDNEKGLSNCVAIYQRNPGESSFGGSISMFYGTQYIYPQNIVSISNGKSIETVNVKGNGDKYSSDHVSLYYYTETKGDKLYVYVKTTDDKDVRLHRFVSIYLSDNSKSQYSSGIGNTSLTSKIAQDSIVVHSVDISTPQVTAADELVWIDNSFNNKTKHYTTYTWLETSPGSYAYYGVRAIGRRGEKSIKYFNNNIYSIGINGLSYNVPATIVKLNPYKEQQNIYSFKDGDELVLLNPTNTGARIENGKWSGNEILSSYAHSYEYIIDKTRLDENNPKDYNFRFYPGKAFAYYTVENAYSKNYAYIHVPYTKTETFNGSYSRVTNLNRMRPTNEFSYSPKYIKYENNSRDSENTYSQVVEYVKVPANSVSFEYFKEVANRDGSGDEFGTGLFYKYSTVTNNYVRYINDDLANMSSTPLNLYVKQVYYTKVRPNAQASGEYYYRDYTYSRYTPKASSEKDRLYELITNNTFQNINGKYIPVTGFVRDGSAPYYGFRLVPLSDAEYLKSFNASSPIIGSVEDLKNSVFIRSHYMEMFENTKAPSGTQEIKNVVGKFKVNNIPIYRLEKLLKFVPITKSDATVYDIDITGNTIYSCTEEEAGIFDINDIRNKLQQIPWTTSAADRDNIIRDETNDYRLSNFKINSNGDKISYIVTFEGSFQEVDYTKAEEEIVNNQTSTDPLNLYVLDDEYHYNKYSFNDDAVARNTLNKLSFYKADDYIFVRVFGKLETEFLNDYNRRAFIVPNNAGNIRVNKGQVYYNLGTDQSLNLKTITTYNDGSDNGQNTHYTGLISGSNTFYQYNQTYVSSPDIYYSVNNEYYLWQTQKTTMSYIYRAKGSEEISGVNGNLVTYIPELDTKVNENGKIVVKHKTGYNYNPEDIRYYTANISYFSYDPGTSGQGLSQIVGANANENFYKEALAITDPRGKEFYTYNIYFKTKYFYPEFTYNDGIHVDVSGSYYTNLYVYDGKSGSRVRKMLLNNYKYDISHYSFDITTRSQIEVASNTLQPNISIYDYKNYYVRYEDEQGNVIDEQLSENSESPAYYVSLHTYSLFTYINDTATQEYNAIGVHQLSYGPDDHKEPVVLEMNNNFYGLIFSKDITHETTTSLVTFTEDYNQLDADGFVDFHQGPERFTDFNFDENDVNTDDPTKAAIWSDALDAMNDELYYNDYAGRDATYITFNLASFTPDEYLYEIVPLSRFTFRHYDGDRSIIQAKSVTTENIISTIPFSISNAEELSFPGTYTWIPPKYNTLVGPDGTSKTVIAQDGYWKKDYKIEKKPFNIASYNYYPKDEVNMVNISYNYMPYSYIVTAEINHPEISYETLTTEIREEIRYSYLLNGFEFDYPSSSPLVYKNGAYYGVTYLYDMDGTYINMQVPLYKRNDVAAAPIVKSYELQPEFVSYSYFAYIQATPLTNEKIPVLYNTELMPATTRKVQYWDAFKNSYAIKTVIDSYAYYSYKYIYETIPFKVASYIFTEDLGISNFPVLGAYIDNITKTLGESLGQQSAAVNGLTENTSDLLKQKIEQDEKWYGVHNVSFKTYTGNLTDTVSNLDTNTNESLSKLSTSLSDRITILTAKEEAAINALSENTVKVITNQHNIIKDGLTHNADTINERFTSFENKYHEDTIGNASLENIPTTYERVTYRPIINGPSGLVTGYSYIKETGQQTVKAGGSSLGEILKNSLGSMLDYTKTDVHEDGSYTVTTYKGFMGIANILANLSINKKLPDYNEFMVDLTPKLFSAVDFEGDYDIVYDINGNIKSKKKRNPTDIAKKCIMRADILWNELKKKGIVH